MHACSPTMAAIMRQKSVENFKPDPYIATVLNCFVWTFYGLPFVHPDSTLVVTINGAGAAIELFYVLIFVIFSSWGKRVRVLNFFFLFKLNLKPNHQNFQLFWS